MQRHLPGLHGQGSRGDEVSCAGTGYKADDGYGETFFGGPWLGDGIGRLWPILTSERSEYEIARGRDASIFAVSFHIWSEHRECHASCLEHVAIHSAGSLF